MQEHKYNLFELEEMIPWEREVYLAQLENHIKAEQMRLEQIKKLKG